MDEEFAICRLPADAALPSWAFAGCFSSVTRTADELSIVCPAKSVPAGMQAEKGWVGFKLIGPLPFSQPGVLASFLDPLAERGIPVFAVSRYETDYVLVKADLLGIAIDVLREAGHELWPKD
jgi:hypothetical protein